MQLLLDIQHENKMGTGFQKTVAVMAYELGDLAKVVVYGHLDDVPDSAYRAEAWLALADLFTQCRVMAELLDRPFFELLELGYERFVERARECQEGVI